MAQKGYIKKQKTLSFFCSHSISIFVLFLTIIIFLLEYSNIIRMANYPVSESFLLTFISLVSSISIFSITVVSISISMIKEKIYSVPSLEFTKLRNKRWLLSFLDVMILQILLIVFSLIVIHYNFFVSFISFSIEMIAISIYFIIQEIPVLLRDERTLLRIVKTAVRKAAISQPRFDDLENPIYKVVLYLLYKRSLLSLFNLIKYKNKNKINLNKKLLSFLIEVQERELFNLKDVDYERAMIEK